MSALNRDYDDVLRRALRAAADSVEPSADGLERIRARLSGPPLLSFASSPAWYSDAAVRFTTWSAPIREFALKAFWWVVQQFRPASASPARGSRRLAWLRPLAAMGTAIFVVAAGAFAVMTLPQAITSSGSSFGGIFESSPHHSGPGGGSGTSGVGTGTGSPIPGFSRSLGPSGGPSSSSPVPSRCKSPRPARTGSATPAPSISSSTTPSVAPSSPTVSSTPSVTPTPSLTPSPTPSGTGSPGPGSVSTASPSASPLLTHTSPATVRTAAASGPQAPFQDPHQAVMLPATPCPSPAVRKSRSPVAGGLAAAGITVGGVATRVTRSDVS